MPSSHEHWSVTGPEGATPVDPSDLEGLKLSWVANRNDLNIAEQASIARALSTRKWQRMALDDVLDDLTLRQLHKAMFAEVWRWAGQYRHTEVSIGVAPERVSVAVRDLVADTHLWVAGPQPSPIDDAAVMFHHRLVAIHPFPNGNGRHARAATDLLLRSAGTTAFSWGSASLDDPSETRARYIAALRRADAGDLGPLGAFVRS